MTLDADHRFDVVVVGTGVGGLTAALTAALDGLSVVVVEQAPVFGGTSAVSGGAIWIPNNSYVKQVWPDESRERAERYLAAVIGDGVPRSRWEAYLDGGTRMVDELAERTKWVQWQHVPYMDYHPEVEGASPVGRTLEPLILDGKALGEDLKNLRPPVPAMDVKGLPMTLEDFFALNMITRIRAGKLALLRVIGRAVRSKLRRQRPLVFGQALVGRVRAALAELDAPVWLSTPFVDLVTEDSAVTGVRVERGGVPVTIHATRGVVLAAGGFTRDEVMRKTHLPEPTSTDWSLAPEDGQHGDAIRSAMQIGAATDFLDRAWGIPVVRLPVKRDGELSSLMLLTERALPGTLIVNGAGERYLDEAQLYDTFFTEMYEQEARQRPTVPSWFVFDQRVKNRYLLFGVPALMPFPRAWVRDGHIHRAKTLDQLATSIGVPADALKNTVTRYNMLARAGRDDDFGRGRGYDRYYGDPTLPHPNLNELDRAPYYAVAIYPGDFNTKGGLLADGDGRVLDADHTPIQGLYAVGNTSTTPWGDGSPGPGGTLAPPMVFGYLAAKHIASTASGSPQLRGRGTTEEAR